jgi:hypothetical protein
MSELTLKRKIQDEIFRWIDHLNPPANHPFSTWKPYTLCAIGNPFMLPHGFRAGPSAGCNAAPAARSIAASPSASSRLYAYNMLVNEQYRPHHTGIP